MVTQLLAGETYTVLNEQQDWLLVRIQYDGYEGWIDQRQFHPVDEDFFQDNLQCRVLGCNQPFIVASQANHHNKLLIPRGADLPFYADGIFRIGEIEYQLPTDDDPDFIHTRQPSVQKIARLYMHTPYLWGGRSPAGLDCSGFTQLVFKICGKSLPRDASQQAATGETIDFINEALPGDLAFFDNAAGSIIHTGILLGNGKIVHASGFVREDMIDHHGIFNISEKKYSHTLRLIKRII